MSQDISTTIGLSANATSTGQHVEWENAVVTNCVITNNSGQSIQYSLDGSTWVTVANGATASPTVSSPASFRLRKTGSDSYPVGVGLSWTARDALDPASVAITGGTAVLSGGKIGGLTMAGKALTALNLAAFRPVDLVMIGDSHQNMDGYGYNDAFEFALAKRFGMYATPLYSQEIVGSSYSNCGHASAGFNTGSVGATTGAPAGQAPYALALRNYCYIAAGAIGNTNGVDVYGQASYPFGLDSRANLRCHYAYGTFASGGGSFLPQARLEVSPYSTLVTGTTVNCQTGADGRAIATLDIGASATRTQDIGFKWQLPGGTASVGPTTFLWQRVENRDRLSGISVNTLYGVGGQSGYDMAAAIQALSDAQLQQFMKDVAYLQIQRGFDPICVFYCCTGHNDRNETSSPSLGPLPSSTPSSYQAYVDNQRAIYARLKAMWVAAGFSASGFFYLAMPSHPVNSTPDDANLISYRAAILRWAAGTPDASVVDVGALLTNNDILSNGGYKSGDSIHLNPAGYDFVTEKALTANFVS